MTQSLDDPSGGLTMSRRGEPDIIPEFAVKDGIDLVVMAAGEGGITEVLFGRASHKLLQRLTCSLLAVRR